MRPMTRDDEASREKPPPLALGLVGGLGPGATVHYYEALAKAFAARGLAPRLFISHANFSLVMAHINAGARDALADYLADHVGCLSRAGADFMAIGAVAPHICADQLRARIQSPLVDITDCVAAELKRRGARRVAVLGARTVMESAMYGRLGRFDVVELEPGARDFVQQNYTQLAASGRAAGADVEGLRRVAKALVADRGVDTVILAGTDLSLVFRESDCGFPALDCARAHLDLLTAYAFGDLPLPIGEERS